MMMIIIIIVRFRFMGHWANTAQTDQVTLRPPPWPTIGPTRLRLIRWPCELHLDLTIGLTAGGDAVSDTDSRWLFHFHHHCGIRDLADLLSFLTQSPTGFHDTWRNDWRWQGTESKHSGSDPADIRIRIQINPEIRIQISRLRLDSLVKVCALWEQSS